MARRPRAACGLMSPGLKDVPACGLQPAGWLATRTGSVVMPPSIDHDELIRRLSRDLEDSYDEELEMETEDSHPVAADSPMVRTPTEHEERRRYFRELFKLQGELVKLQDWVVATQQKVVILFEGRDAAGKGGAIKRI